MLGRQIAFGGITAVLVGCSADTPAPTALELRAPVYAVGANSDINLGTHLTGDEEVFVGAPGAPTPADSKAQGQAIFRVNDDGPPARRVLPDQGRRTVSWRPARLRPGQSPVLRPAWAGCRQTLRCRCSMRSGAGSPMSTFTRTMEWACLTPDLGISRVERFAGRSITRITRRKYRVAAGHIEKSPARVLSHEIPRLNGFEPLVV